MDVHINLSYCTVDGLHFLVSNYLGDESKCHPLYEEIEGLIQVIGVTPAEIAEELMKSEDADVALEGVVNLLKRKKTDADEKKQKEEEKEKEKEKEKIKEKENKDDDEKSTSDDGRKTARKRKRKKRKNKRN